MKRLAFFVFVLLVLAATWAFPVVAKGNPGDIFTQNSCGSPINQNHYSVGDTVVVVGKGFEPGLAMELFIVGKPGGASSHPNQVVAGPTSVNVDEDGTFCVDLHVVGEGEWGEFSVKTSTGKNDNYRVQGKVEKLTATPNGPDPTVRPTEKPRDTATPKPTVTEVVPTEKPVDTATPKPTATEVRPTSTPKPTETEAPRDTATPKPTRTVRPTDAPTETVVPSATQPATPTVAPTETPVPTSVFTSTPVWTATTPPSATPTPTRPPYLGDPPDPFTPTPSATQIPTTVPTRSPQPAEEKSGEKKVEKTDRPSENVCMTQEVMIADVTTGGRTDIARIFADGSYKILTSGLEGNSTQGEVSPDGCSIAFVNTAKLGEKGDIWVMSVDGSNPRNITQSPEEEDSSPSYASNYWLAYVKDGQVWVIDAAGDNVRSLGVEATHVAALPFSGPVAFSSPEGQLGIASFWGTERGLEMFQNTSLDGVSWSRDGYIWGVFHELHDGNPHPGYPARFDPRPGNRVHYQDKIQVEDLDVRTDRGHNIVFVHDGQLYVMYNGWRGTPAQVTDYEDSTFNNPDWWHPIPAKRLIYFHFAK